MSRNTKQDEARDCYEPDELVLMPRNVHTAYAYWGLSGTRTAIAERCFGDEWDKLAKALRCYRVDSRSGWRCERELILGGTENHVFISGLIPGLSYAADFGVVTKQGRFVAILRSNMAELPRLVGGGIGCEQEQQSGLNRLLPAQWIAPVALGGPKRSVPPWMDRFTGYTLHDS